MNLWRQAITFRGCAYRDGGESSTVVLRIARFPRLESELKPRPRTLFVSCRQLQCPHVVKPSPRVIAKLSVLSIIAGKNQGVEDRFGTAGLVSLVIVSFAVVEGADLFPKAYTLDDIV